MLLLITLLLLKHFIIDFVFQTDDQVKSKGIYGNITGISHSFEHGAMTMFILSLFFSINLSLIIGCIDMIIHYHIDWIKMKFGNRDITKSAFWMQLGLDQLMHQLTYIGIVYYVFGGFL
jgi:hypothetical protein